MVLRQVSCGASSGFVWCFVGFRSMDARLLKPRHVRFRQVDFVFFNAGHVDAVNRGAAEAL